MSKILCSTGAIIGRPNGRNYKILSQVLPLLSCDGIEFMMYSTWYGQEAELIKFLLSLNTNIPVVHCQKSVGEYITQGALDQAVKSFSINCELAKEIGAKSLVFHLWNGIISDSNFKNNLSAYPILAETAGKYGITLLIENVVCNCCNPFTHWLELIKLYPNVKFVFDTKMAAFHNQIDLLYDPNYAFLHKNHIRHYHLNDYAGGYMDWENLKTLPIGKGKINFDRFFRYVNQIGYNGTLTVESTAFDSEGKINLELLNNQFNLIRTSLNKKEM